MANGFVHAIASQNYNRAYNDFAPSLASQTSRTQFTQQAQSEDRCYGVVTTYMGTGTTPSGNSLIYNYTHDTCKAFTAISASSDLATGQFGELANYRLWQQREFGQSMLVGADLSRPPVIAPYELSCLFQGLNKVFRAVKALFRIFRHRFEDSLFNSGIKVRNQFA